MTYITRAFDRWIQTVVQIADEPIKRLPIVDWQDESFDDDIVKNFRDGLYSKFIQWNGTRLNAENGVEYDLNDSYTLITPNQFSEWQTVMHSPGKKLSNNDNPDEFIWLPEQLTSISYQGLPGVATTGEWFFTLRMDVVLDVFPSLSVIRNGIMDFSFGDVAGTITYNFSDTSGLVTSGNVYFSDEEGADLDVHMTVTQWDLSVPEITISDTPLFSLILWRPED